MQTSKKYKSLSEFYPFYLTQHQKPLTKLFHFIGTNLGSTMILSSIWNGKFSLAGLFVAYLMAWISHFFIEKNKPATFQYPLYSFMSDWIMNFEIIAGKHRIIPYLSVNQQKTQ